MDLDESQSDQSKDRGPVLVSHPLGPTHVGVSSTPWTGNGDSVSGTIDPRWVSPQGSVWSTPIPAPIGGTSPPSTRSRESSQASSPSLIGDHKDEAVTKTKNKETDHEADAGDTIEVVNEIQPSFLPVRYDNSSGLAAPTLATISSSHLDQ
jgi:hypothetical protein